MHSLLPFNRGFMGYTQRLKRFICAVLTWHHVQRAWKKGKSKMENERRRGGKLIQVILILCDAHNSFARAQRKSRTAHMRDMQNHTLTNCICT